MVSHGVVIKGSRVDNVQDLVSLLVQRIWTASTSAIPGQPYQEYDTIHSIEYVRPYGHFFYAPFNKFIDYSFVLVSFSVDPRLSRLCLLAPT